MGWEHSMCGHRTEAYRVLPRKPQGKRLSGRILIILKMIFMKLDQGYGLELPDSG